MLLRQIILILLITVTIPIKAQWELVVNKNDIKVYNKPGEDGYSFYKECALVTHPLSLVYQFFIDIENYSTWINNCTEIQPIKFKKEYFYRYASYYDMPWPVQNRFSVSEISIIYADADSVILRSAPYTDHNIKYKGALEVNRFGESVKLYRKDSTTTMVMMEGAYDPGGLIPSWLVDKFLQYGPYDIMIKIRNQLDERSRD